MGSQPRGDPWPPPRELETQRRLLPPSLGGGSAGVTTPAHGAASVPSAPGMQWAAHLHHTRCPWPPSPAIGRELHFHVQPPCPAGPRAVGKFTSAVMESSGMRAQHGHRVGKAPAWLGRQPHNGKAWRVESFVSLGLPVLPKERRVFRRPLPGSDAGPRYRVVVIGGGTGCPWSTPRDTVHSSHR